ncbi:MAG: MMPL family transporter [Pseudomonadota bacterium]
MTNQSTKGSRLYETLISFIVEQRKVLVVVVIALSALAASQVPKMQADVTLKSGVNTDTPEYARYQEFLKAFGSEEFILAAISIRDKGQLSALLKGIEVITSEFQKIDKIVEVVSLTDLKVFRERNGLFGNYPLVVKGRSGPTLIDRTELEKIRSVLPFIDMAISPDEKTFGIIVRMDDKWSFDPPVIEDLVDKMSQAVSANIPPGAEFRIIGAPIIRKAIHHYNIQTAFTFGLLCMLVCTLVSMYIFKSLKAMAVTVTVVGLCDLWILGIMAWMGIQINSTTALAFGMVLISGVEPVIHLVTHYNECFREIGQRLAAAKAALMLGAAPCLVTSFTTALGFSSLMAASVPMVRQLGLILSLGPLVAFILSVILAPALLVATKPLNPDKYQRMSSDLLTRGFDHLEHFVLSHHRSFTAAILIFIGIMVAGSPFIRSDTQILRMLTERTDEIKDIRFVENHLGPLTSLEILIEADENAFKSEKAWKQVKAMEQGLSKLSEVVRVDSPLPLLEYLHSEMAGKEEQSSDLFSNPDAVTELLGVIPFSAEGRRLLSRYLDGRFSKLHVSVRFKNSPGVTLSETIEQVKSVAGAAMKGTGTVHVTGDLAVFEGQASDIVSSQRSSLVLAVLYMSLLLAIQFRSLTLGFVSLLPQILPQSVIFGTMGWFGISLDSVTVFAASVSIGLTVDNTVHFLTQLKREIRSGDKWENLEQCLSEAYRVTARAMISNHAVILFGFAMLLISPFRPVVAFGILGSLAILFSLVGDLVFMPSAILSSSLIRKMLTREMGRGKNSSPADAESAGSH